MRDDDERAAPPIPHAAPADVTGTAAVVEREKNPVRRFLKILGPGLITGASDDDPSGIGTYATAGASLGMTILWTAPYSIPLQVGVQYVCAKVGMVTGLGLAGVLRRYYPRWLLYLAVAGLAVANTITAGADIGAIAAGVNLVAGLPIGWTIVPVTLLLLALQIWGSYRLIANVFKWLTLGLFAYVAAGVAARPDWGEALRHTFVPAIRFDGAFLSTLVAILGTTISPYLFFWQASEEVEEEVEMGRVTVEERQGATKRELEYAWLDICVGMFFCSVVFYFIVLTTAATLHANGQTDITSAADAAQALRPIAGDAAGLLFAAGLVGAGLLAVPVLTASAAYAVSEAFGWRYGLSERPERAKQFYGVIAVATLAGMALDFVGINPIDGLFWAAVINGFVAPPLLVLIMLMSNNRAVMGTRVNNRVTNVVGWLTTGVMFAAAIGLVLAWVAG